MPTDEVVLISSDGLIFTTSRSLLIKHSTFFAGLLSLPSAEHESAPIELPSATSAGLGLVLGILACISPTGSKAHSLSMSPMAYKYWMAITEPDLIVVAEAALCADAYDFTMFDRFFVRPVLERLSHQPILAFALAAVTKQDGALRNLAEQTLVGQNRPEIPHELRNVLERFAPDASDRLWAMYRQYPSMRHRLELELRATEPIPNENQDFARRCSTGRTCSAYDYEKKWRVLRAEAAVNVYQEVLAGTGGVGGHHSILSIVKRTVPCGVCATRLTKAFFRAVDHFTTFRESF